ncbi:MAG TPA: TetR/AcrR family transcriptional regulator [Gammaproteobacteria bacterium]|jgi:AcrR family transcriptional regulator
MDAMLEMRFAPEQIPLLTPAEGIDEDSDRVVVRRTILSVAKRRFARFSYEGTSLSAIARGSGINAAELMRHFPDKTAILLAVLDGGWASINPRLTDIVVTSVNAREAMLSMLGVMMRVLEREEDLARLLLFEARHSHPETGVILLSRGHRRFVELVTEVALRGQRDGSFKASHPPKVLASLMVGAVENLMRDQLVARHDSEKDSYSSAGVFKAFEAMISNLRP